MEHSEERIEEYKKIVSSIADGKMEPGNIFGKENNAPFDPLQVHVPTSNPNMYNLLEDDSEPTTNENYFSGDPRRLDSRLGVQFFEREVLPHKTWDDYHNDNLTRIEAENFLKKIKGLSKDELNNHLTQIDKFYPQILDYDEDVKKNAIISTNLKETIDEEIIARWDEHKEIDSFDEFYTRPKRLEFVERKERLKLIWANYNRELQQEYEWNQFLSGEAHDETMDLSTDDDHPFFNGVYQKFWLPVLPNIVGRYLKSNDPSFLLERKRNLQLFIWRRLKDQHALGQRSEISDDLEKYGDKIAYRKLWTKHRADHFLEENRYLIYQYPEKHENATIENQGYLFADAPKKKRNETRLQQFQRFLRVYGKEQADIAENQLSPEQRKLLNALNQTIDPSQKNNDIYNDYDEDYDNTMIIPDCVYEKLFEQQQNQSNDDSDSVASSSSSSTSNKIDVNAILEDKKFMKRLEDELDDRKMSDKLAQEFLKIPRENRNQETFLFAHKFIQSIWEHKLSDVSAMEQTDNIISPPVRAHDHRLDEVSSDSGFRDPDLHDFDWMFERLWKADRLSHRKRTRYRIKNLS